jgi:hypothetical protein
MKSPPLVAKTKQPTTLEKSPYFEDIVAKLNDGQSAMSITNWLHETCGVFGGISQGALRKQISRLKQQLDSGEDDVMARRIAARTAQVEELDHLERLRKTQWARIQQQRKQEKKLPILLEKFRHELAEYRQIVHLITSLKQSLGIYDRLPVPGEGGQGGDIHIHKHDHHGDTKVVDLGGRFAEIAEDPKKRRRVLSVLETMMKPERTPEEEMDARMHIATRGSAEPEVIDAEVVEKTPESEDVEAEDQE